MRRKELERVYPLIKLLSQLSPNDRKTVIVFLNEEGRGGLYDCIHNGISNSTLDRDRRKIIRKALLQTGEHENYRQLIKETLPNKKHQKLVQVGGAGLGVLLNSILPVIAQHIYKK